VSDSFHGSASICSPQNEHSVAGITSSPRTKLTRIRGKFSQLDFSSIRVRFDFFGVTSFRGVHRWRGERCDKCPFWVAANVVISEAPPNLIVTICWKRTYVSICDQITPIHATSSDINSSPNLPGVRGCDFHESELQVGDNRPLGRVVSCTGDHRDYTPRYTDPRSTQDRSKY
jgi:hypothetical protein